MFPKKNKKNEQKSRFSARFARFSSFFCVFLPYFQVQKSAFSMGAFFGKKRAFLAFFAKNHVFDSFFSPFKGKVVVENLRLAEKRFQKGSHRTIFLSKKFFEILAKIFGSKNLKKLFDKNCSMGSLFGPFSEPIFCSFFATFKSSFLARFLPLLSSFSCSFFATFQIFAENYIFCNI